MRSLLRRLGRLMAKIPSDQKWLYPFYLAGTLTRRDEHFVFPSLPEAFDGMTVAFVSDIHFGPFLGQKRAEDLARRVNAMKADLVLLGGDFGEDAAAGAELFQYFHLEAPPLGIFASIGNHDLKGSPDDVAALKDRLKKSGVTVLQNGFCDLERGGGVIRLAATDDSRLGAPDPDILFSFPSPFTLFFPHSPDILPEVLSRGQKAFDLCLCGHTHGGQVSVFGHALLSSSVWGDRYLSGRKKENGHEIFISNGVGTSLFPVRLGAPPQYHLITLTRK